MKSIPMERVVLDVLEAHGWRATGGPSLAVKMFHTACGPKQAAIWLSSEQDDDPNRGLSGVYWSEGGNVLAPLRTLIPRTAGAGKIRTLTNRFVIDCLAAIAESYAARLERPCAAGVAAVVEMIEHHALMSTSKCASEKERWLLADEVIAPNDSPRKVVEELRTLALIHRFSVNGKTGRRARWAIRLRPTVLHHLAAGFYPWLPVDAREMLRYSLGQTFEPRVDALAFG
jgi:hypothetical protein